MNEQRVLARLQKAELTILEAISALCEAYDINWWLDGGTCLGAVRHGGFIPWDDDVDVGMLRSDYDRFCELALTELPDGYSLHVSNNTDGYAAMFAKVYKDGTRFENQEGRDAKSKMGIFVDVFPYDCLYEESGLRSSQISKAAKAQRLSYLYYSANITVPHRGLLGSVERIGCKVLHAVVRACKASPFEFQRDFDGAIPDSNVGAVSDECLTLAWPNMNPIPVSEILPASRAKFEGGYYPVPRLTDKYLTTMYGDWRSIPSPEERHTHLPLLIDFGDGDIWESDK